MLAAGEKSEGKKQGEKRGEKSREEGEDRKLGSESPAKRSRYTFVFIYWRYYYNPIVNSE